MPLEKVVLIPHNKISYSEVACTRAKVLWFAVECHVRGAFCFWQRSRVLVTFVRVIFRLCLL